MKLRTLFAAAVAGAFAVPFAAQASVDGDRMVLAQAGGPAGASSVGSGPTGGSPSPQSAGEPAKQADRPASAGATTERCLSMTGDEREKCMRDAGIGAGSGASVGAGASSSTGTTAGPGEASPRTGAGSDTATTPSTSGTGKAQ
jgi:hypothetical protein